VYSPDEIKTLAAEVVIRCRELAALTETPGCISRTFLSPPMRECHQKITAWIQAGGGNATVDAAGNLRGLFPASRVQGPRLMIGSHLDSVPNAGAYDGVLGVMIALALAKNIEAQNLPFAIEVVGFSEEEGVRFGTPFIGSRALVGRLDDQLLNVQDAAGISVRAAIENFGLNPAEIPGAILAANTLAYLEFHIEQGPVLESLGRPLAAVDAIVGQTRMEFLFCGTASHAGTTPMHLRHDALAAAAEWIVAVEHAAREDPELVATVGKIEAIPGAANVIAGEARAVLDLRHKSDNPRKRAIDSLIQTARLIADRRGISIETKILLDQSAVKMDGSLVQQIEVAIRKTGSEPHRMVSGAGHDAMILAEKVPSAMIFVRSPGGISHHPSESVHFDDIAKAIECGSHLLEQLARTAQFRDRMSRA
jgi:allantoate deiminase